MEANPRRGPTIGLVTHFNNEGFALGYLVTQSSLSTVGTLSSLNVAGAAALGPRTLDPSPSTNSGRPKARRLVVISRNAIAPSYLQARMAQALPLPRVTFVPVMGGHGGENEESQKLRTMLAFVLAIGGGPEGHGMPRDVFRVVLDMLMPRWDPLRYKSAEAEKVRLLMLGLAGKMPDLMFMTTEAELRHWVELNPGRVNDRGSDYRESTFLFVAACVRKSLPLTLLLLDEKGADVNATTSDGSTALHEAYSLGIVTALLDHSADSIRLNDDGVSPLMRQALIGKIEIVVRLLQDPRVRATINIQSNDGRTALHCACNSVNGTEANQAALVILLLQSGANYTRTDADGKTPLALLRQRYMYRPGHAVIPILEQAPDAEKASLLIKA